MRWWVFFSTVVVCAGTAMAAGYDDFSAGVTAELRGENERAVAALTLAIAAPDLAAAYRPAAYRARAHAYLQLEKCQEAAADLKAYEALKKPGDLIVIYKVWANLCLKDGVAARKEIAALSKGKLDSEDLFEFSRLAWRYGLFDEAARSAGEAFAGADKEESRAAYMLLWQALNALRAGNLDPAAIAASLATTKLYAWPKPVFDLFLGTLSPADLQKEAKSWLEDDDTAQRCEANFYTAEWYLARSDKAAATPLLIAAAQKCPDGYIERISAALELKRLGVPLPKE